MIEINNITKKFADFTAVDGISFAVGESSVYGLVGCNGAGKTTLLKIAAGIYRADGGEVLMNGKNVFDNEEIRREMFYVPDELYFLPAATMSSMAEFYKGYYSNFSDKVFKNIAGLLGLDIKKRLFGFSKGMQRQAELAFALASRPKFMLLDECLDGIDPQKRSVCRELLLEHIAVNEGSVIMASHNLPELANLCDHIGLINGKKLLVNCDVDSIGNYYTKYRIIFNNENECSVLDGINCTNVKTEGRITTFIKKGDSQCVEDYLKMKEITPIDITKSAMTLEEIFVNEMGENDYDISKIFKA